MHPLIDEILAASRERGFAAVAPWPKAERRDLIASARALKSSGLIPIIAEIKPKALGRALATDEVAAYAAAYRQHNACAVSVLTEPTNFMGALHNALIARSVGLPILRKDFIFDERQLAEVQADLILLLDRFVNAARAYGMETLLEVHNEKELDAALKTDAKIIGVNNRNLNTLEVDLGTFERLAPWAKEAGVFLVAESGVHSHEDALRMMQAGADALLVGTELMARPERLGELNSF
jgi:indole-3-glycerol phosphate synthase